jgi:hypothetical protein
LEQVLLQNQTIRTDDANIHHLNMYRSNIMLDMVSFYFSFLYEYEKTQQLYKVLQNQD